MNNKNKQIKLILGVLLLGILTVAGSFAFWTWTSSENKTVLFNTSGDLAEYIEYDEGESKFIGDLAVSDSYLDGAHTTISIKKTQEATNVDLFATINMKINEIGTNMSKSRAVKWTITRGNSTNPGVVLNEGNFLGASKDESLELYSNIEVTTSIQEFTIWLWIDEGENPSEKLSGETLDTVIWTQVDQITTDRFEITRFNSEYQLINATVVNSMYKITHYQVTTSNTQPSSWESIPSGEQGYNYLLEYEADATGKYYVWFKDSAGNVVSKDVTVGQMDSTAPVCTWSEFSKDSIADGEEATISLTCTDSGIGLDM